MMMRSAWWFIVPAVAASVVMHVDAQSAPAFEIASIRLSNADTPGSTRIWPGGRYTATGTTVRALMLQAYRWEITRSQLSGGPDWIDSERYDIHARAGEGAVSNGQINRATAQLVDQMLQQLLADRFKLRVRRDAKDGQTYALVVARGGPKLTASDPAVDCSALTPNALPLCHVIRSGARGLQGERLNMDDLAMGFRQLLGQPVVDKTGIDGLFDVAVTWAPDTARANANRIGANEPAGDPNAPDMFTALQEQLGLRLESQRAAINVLVIEHVERPTGN